MIKRILVAAGLFLATLSAAPAQFADQATYAGTGGGTANAQTITVANASAYADVKGVVLKFFPGATNTGAATLNLNGFGSAPPIVKPSGSGMTALTGGEVVSGQATYVMYDGTNFNLVSPTSLPIGAGSLLPSAFGFNPSTNMQINATVNANALTIALKANNGNDATSSNPIVIPFRSATLANGQPDIASVTGALSFTINNGSTMGCQNNTPCRLWIVAMNNAGSVALCAFNAVTNTTISPISEDNLTNSASGTVGGNSYGTYYCSTGSLVGKAIRILGYIEVAQATAGVWAVGPTKIQLFGPGIKKPGDVVQVAFTTTTSTTSCNSSSFTVPTAVTLGMTMTSTANLMEVDVINIPTTGVNITAAYQISRGTGPSLIGIPNQAGGANTATPTFTVPNSVIDVLNSTNPRTYYVYCSYGTSGFTDNGGTIKLKEIMGAIEPIEDHPRKAA